MKFFSEIWSEYRELAKSLIGTVLELGAVSIVIKSGNISSLISIFAPHALAGSGSSALTQ
jgi:hypothetical protein